MATRPLSTPHYLSPELCNPPDRTTAQRMLQSDVWAWGCLLLEVGLVGLSRAYSTNETVLQISTDKYPFHDCNAGPQLLFKIARHQLPSDVDELELCGDPQNLLEACRSPMPKDHPKIDRCPKMLSYDQVMLHCGTAGLSDRETLSILEETAGRKQGYVSLTRFYFLMSFTLLKSSIDGGS
jgi:hypothetical protein